MTRHYLAAVAAAAALLVGAGEARATQVCGWMVETVKADDLHEVTLYLEADREFEFLYKIGGRGMVDSSGHSHSPGSGTYVLHPAKAESPWGFGATLSPPGKIDISVALHQKPADIFDEKPTPILAQFTFQRTVPDGETKAPPTLAKKQCTTVK